ncbi:MAG: hypothetical protein QOF65_881 [Thermoleophilaceae bacterium]|jgi:hypothetical protein|nr:hypothetical protein [Thermoleophilaceae bacterium]MEA2436325.1 hypothetical protein [Thermoleophilaceae bacterium]
MSVAPVLQLEAALLRRQLPDLLLRPGMTLFARVAEREGRHGIIVLAGSPLVAELPDEVQVGDKLRLLVQDTRGERVAMKLVQEQPTAALQTPVIGLPLPDGTQARIHVDDEDPDASDDDDPEHASISIGYASPALGSIGFVLSLAPGAVKVHAELAAGEPFELASDAADDLRSRLAEATGRAAEVTVTPRREPLDLYA